MNYKLATIGEAADGRVVLVKATGALVAAGVILVSVGGVLLLGGIGAVAAGELEPYGLVLTGLGVAFLLGGVFAFLVRAPDRFVFDNNRGALLVEERGPDGRPMVTAQPYDAIDGFLVRRQVTVSDGQKSVKFLVELLKTDGARWTLCSRGREAEAEAICEQLRWRVDLGRTGGGPVERPASERFEVRTATELTRIRWRRESARLRMTLVLLLFGGVSLAIWGGRDAMGTHAFIAGIAVLAVFWSIILHGMATSLATHHEIEITPTRFLSAPRGAPFRVGRFEMDTAEIDTVLFNFGLDGGDEAIYLLRPEERERLLQLKAQDVSPGEVVDVLRMLLRVRRIVDGELRVGEKLALEQLLQDEIARVTGRSPR